jgi:hypothetical protein
VSADITSLTTESPTVSPVVLGPIYVENILIVTGRRERRKGCHKLLMRFIISLAVSNVLSESLKLKTCLIL